MVKDYLFKKPNRKPTSQVSPHQDKKYNEGSKLFEPKPITKTIPADSVVDVEFSVNNTAPDQYDEIQFTDNTTNAVEWYWDFGDGFTSTEQNPVHVYGGGAGSTYTVRLIVKDSQNRVGIAVKEDLIEVQSGVNYFGDTLTDLLFFWDIYKGISTATYCVRIREDNNNNEQNFGFDSNGLVDVNAIESFKNNNNATTVYYVGLFNQLTDSIEIEETDASKQNVFDTSDPNLNPPKFSGSQYPFTPDLQINQNKPIYAGCVFKGMRNSDQGRNIIFSTDTGNLFQVLGNTCYVGSYNGTPSANTQRPYYEFPNNIHCYEFFGSDDQINGNKYHYVRADGYESFVGKGGNDNFSKLTTLFVNSRYKQARIKSIIIAQSWDDKKRFLAYVRNLYSSFQQNKEV